MKIKSRISPKLREYTFSIKILLNTLVYFRKISVLLKQPKKHWFISALTKICKKKKTKTKTTTTATITTTKRKKMPNHYDRCTSLQVLNLFY